MVLHLRAEQVGELEPGEAVDLEVLAVLREEIEGLPEDRESNEREDDDRDGSIALEDVFDERVASHPEEPAATPTQQAFARGEAGRSVVLSGGGHG